MSNVIYMLNGASGGDRGTRRGPASERRRLELSSHAPSMRMQVLRAGIAAIGIPAALAGCALLSGPVMQSLEVQVEAQDPAWAGPLECEASNAAGTWQFVAPGTVTVRISSPLWITCKVPPGALAAKSVTAANPTDAARRAARKGAGAGAVVGGAAGIALVVAAAPVGGAGLGLALAAGSAYRGGEIGGAASLMSAGGPIQMYPDPIVVRIVQAVPPVDMPPQPGDVRARQRP